MVKDREFELKVLEVMKKAGKPVSIDYIAYHCGVAWTTARAVLFRLTVEGKVKAIDTTKSWIFFLPKEGGDNR
mgnify:CR=1 FL=1